MKKIKEMSDHEFIKKTLEVVGTALVFDEVLCFQEPYESQYDSFSSNFCNSRISHGYDDDTYSRIYEDKKACMLYYDVPKVKTYCIIRDDDDSETTKIYMAFEGNPDDVANFRDMAINVYNEETYGDHKNINKTRLIRLKG